MALKKIAVTGCIMLLLVGSCTVLTDLSERYGMNAGASTGTGTVHYVGGTGPDNYTVIQDAVDDAASGDTVYVYPGCYTECLTVDTAITLTGENKNTTVIDAGGGGPAISLTADNATVQGFTIQNWAAGSANSGAVYGTFNECTIAGNRFNGTNGRADYGVWTDGGANDIRGNVFTDIGDKQNNSGGPAIKFGTGAGSDNTVTANRITECVGGIYIYGGGGHNISGNTISLNRCALFFFQSPGNVVYNNDLRDNIDAIQAWYSSSDPNTVLRNNISGNTDDGLDLRYGCGAGWQIHKNNIQGNGGHGVDSDGDCQAGYNFWGHRSGACHPTCNPDGCGDTVSDTVHVTPWLDCSSPDSDYGYGRCSPVDHATVAQTDGSTMVNASSADTTVAVNTEMTTNVTVLRYVGNPEGAWWPETYHLKKYIDVSVENAEAVARVNVTLFYTEADLAEADVTEDTLDGLFYWDASALLWDICEETGVNRTYSRGGYEGYVWAVVQPADMAPMTAAGKESGGGGNTVPHAAFSYTPGSPTDLDVIQFTDGSTDVDGGIVNRTWQMGDGTTLHGPEVSHQYADDGVYTVTLTVTDDDGGSNTTAQSVAVANVPPSAGFTYTFSSKRTVACTDGSLDADGSIVSWTWRFGDGRVSHMQNPVHTYPSGGRYTVNLTVTDDDGDSDSTSASLSIDTAPPHTSILRKYGDGWREVLDDNGGWCNHSVIIAFSADDHGSGTGCTRYRKDGGDWHDGHGIALYIWKEGWHTIEYYSVDRCGNRERCKSYEFGIDKTLPATNHSLQPDQPDGSSHWYHEKVTVALSAHDVHAGINYTEYRIDGGGWRRYTGPVVFKEEGTHVLSYRSVDMVGHTEKTHAVVLHRDASSPSVDIVQPTPGIYVCNRKIIDLPQRTVVIGKIMVDARAHDDVSGIGNMTLYVDGEKKASCSDRTFAWMLDEAACGSREIRVVATDAAGNAASQTRQLWICNV